jgi:cytochrome P450
MRMTDSAGPLAWDDIDLYGPGLYGDGEPHAAWRALRDRAPVCGHAAPDGTPFWSVTRHQDVARVLRDAATFSSEHSTILSSIQGDSARARAIHLTDAPRHGALRRPLVSRLSRQVMRDRQGAIRSRLAALVSTAVRSGPVDFARLIALLPMVVAGDIIGIPEDRWAEAAQWTLASVAPEDPAYQAGTAQATLMRAHVSLMAMFTDLIEERRARPAADLISGLLRLEVDRRPATDEDVLVNCYAFLIGSNTTTPQSASHLVLAAAEQPGLWQRVRADASLVPRAVEELLRWSTPTNHLMRRTRAPVRLQGEQLPEGALVCAWVASANRDERVFASPFTFDPARHPNPHLAFGAGPHRCIGHATARAGLQILIEELAARVTEFRLAGPPRHLRSNFLNGITSLPVELRTGHAR